MSQVKPFWSRDTWNVTPKAQLYEKRVPDQGYGTRTKHHFHGVIGSFIVVEDLRILSMVRIHARELKTSTNHIRIVVIGPPFDVTEVVDFILYGR